MIATVGFVVASIAIAVFAYSFARVFPESKTNYGRAFVVGFVFLSVAMLVCGIGTFSTTPLQLQVAVFIADALLIFATCCAAYAWHPTSHQGVAVGVGVLIAAMLAARAFVEPPTAYLGDGILYFNTEGVSRMVLLGTIALIWLPAVLAVISRIVAPLQLGLTGTLLKYNYALLVMMTVVFFAARQSRVIVISFAAMIALFFMMAGINYYIGHLRAANRRRVHHAK